MPVILDVQPSAYTDAARTLADEVADGVWVAWLRLQAALDETYGMAGTDDTAVAWGSSYERAAGGATAATQDVINACYRLGTLLHQTGVNYADAEASSAPGGRVTVGDARWVSEFVSLGALQSAVGIGLPLPPGWALLQHAIGRLWPDGHQDLLHSAATAWLGARDHVLSLLPALDRAVTALMLQRAPEVTDAVTVLGGMRAHLAELAATYAGIGAACADFAHRLDGAHHGIIEELKSFIETTAVIEAAGGLFAIFTFGASELVAQGGEALEIARAASAVRSIIDALAVAAAELRYAIDAVVTRAAGISTKVQPILARHLQEVRLTMAGDRGEIVIGRAFARRTEPAAATSPEAAAVVDLEAAADVGPASETWAKSHTLARHFKDHGNDFGSVSEEAYARDAAFFRRRAALERLPTTVKADGTQRIYDAKSNTFGVYTSDGRTISFFKPTSKTYWHRQGGVAR